MRRLHLSSMAFLALVLVAAGCGGAVGPTPTSRATTGQVDRLVYVALGDSYTGAPRLGQQVSAACRRTDGNYPHLFAAAHPLSLTRSVDLTDVSCGGARVRHLTRSQKATVPPQLDAVRADAGLVSVAVGGNDVAIMALVEACLTRPVACQRRRAAVLSGVRRMRIDLVAALRQVRARAPRARIVVIGYPEIFPRSGRCGRARHATLARARASLDRIAIAQRNAAREVGATFLDLRPLTRGHGLCTADPWIASRTTATSRQFHPTAEEQRTVAEALTRLVRP